MYIPLFLFITVVGFIFKISYEIKKIIYYFVRKEVEHEEKKINFLCKIASILPTIKQTIGEKKV